MKIAISATGSSLDTEVDPRFGRCQHFIIVDPETMEFEALDNSSVMAAGGAGISAAQAIVNKAVQAVLTGNCGPNAHQVLSTAGIQVITGVSGKVRDVVDGYRSGKFQASRQANVTDHFGMRATPGMGSSSGRGRGMGMGCSMGLDMTPPATPGPQPYSTEQELDMLKDQSQAMAKQLNDIQRRIGELEKKRG